MRRHARRRDDEERRLVVAHDQRGPTAPSGPRAVADSVRRAAARDDRRRQSSVLRYALLVLGVQIIVLAAPSLLFLDRNVESPHDARHIGAFATAYGVGLVLVARRPARARTMLGVGQVLVAALALSAMVDVIDQTVSLTNEFLHLPEVLALVVLWMMSRDNLAPDSSSSRQRD